MSKSAFARKVEMHENSDYKTRDKLKKKLGKRAEKLAIKHIKSKGFKVITRNFETEHGEIDFIAKKDDMIVFAEVRSRIAPSFMDPAESVNETKRKKIALTARDFILGLHIQNKFLRFDVFAILFDEKMKLIELRHIENAFSHKILENFT